MFYWQSRPYPRHPLMRIVVGVVGVFVLLGLIAFGVFALAALAVGGALFFLINALRGPRRRSATVNARPAAPPPGVIEGEFTVVHERTPGA